VDSCEKNLRGAKDDYSNLRVKRITALGEGAHAKPATRSREAPMPERLFITSGSGTFPVFPMARTGA
jgi:hypothetical protein